MSDTHAYVRGLVGSILRQLGASVVLGPFTQEGFAAMLAAEGNALDPHGTPSHFQCSKCGYQWSTRPVRSCPSCLHKTERQESKPMFTLTATGETRPPARDDYYVGLNGIIDHGPSPAAVPILKLERCEE